MLQEGMTLWASHNVQFAKHAVKYKDVRRLVVCIPSLQDVIRARFQSECASARPPTQLQVQQEVAAMEKSAGCVVSAQISVDEPGLHKVKSHRLALGM